MFVIYKVTNCNRYVNKEKLKKQKYLVCYLTPHDLSIRLFSTIRTRLMERSGGAGKFGKKKNAKPF